MIISTPSQRPTVTLIHGRQPRILAWQGRPCDMTFFPHIARSLEGMGNNVLQPNIPSPHDPSIDEWRKELYEPLSQSSIAIAYSMGTVMVLDMLTRYHELALDKLILVACSAGAADYMQENPGHLQNLQKKLLGRGSNFLVSKVSTMYVNILLDRMNKMQHSSSIDFDSVRSRVGEIIVLASTDDLIVPLGCAQEVANKLGAEVIECPNRGHFQDTKQIPELNTIMNEAFGYKKEYTAS